jgi:hypothetical protein
MRISNRIATAFGVWLLASAAFATTTLVVSQDGLTAPNANYGCPAGSANCLSSLDFQLLGHADAHGTIVLDDSGTIATISMDVASATFAPISGIGPNMVFTDVHYAGAVSVFSTSSIISQLGPGTGTVSGLLNGNPFSTSSAVYNLTCAIGGITGQCGVAYGPQVFSAGGQDWLHTFAVLVKPSTPLPEPSTILFVLLGAAGLTLRRR